LASTCAPLNIKSYYFPIHQDGDTKIFKYVNPTDPEFSEYWEVITDPYENSIITHSYNADFTKYNTMYEQYDEEGAKLLSYIDYEKKKDGSWKEIKSETIDDAVFMWDRKNEYAFSVNYVNKFGRFELTKTRKDLGFVDLEIMEEDVKAIKFVDSYYVNAIDQNDKYQFKQISYYADGIGMVKYERNIPNSGLRVLVLVEIMDETKFAKEKRTYLEELKKMK
jgi:hypothetical protein